MRSLALLGACVLALTGCGGDGGGSSGTPTPPMPTPTPTPTPSPSPTPTPSATTWDGFVGETLRQLYARDPAFAVYQGRHQYDGRLPDWSDAGLQQTADFWRDTITRANAFTGLNAAEQFERAYLVQVARGQLFFLTVADQPHVNPIFYVNGGLDPDVYLTREYADPVTRMQAVVRFLQAIPATAATIRANLHPPLPAPFITLGSGAFAGFATYYRNDVPAAFAGVGDAALQQQLSEAATTAAQAMNTLSAFVGGSASTPNFALGPDRFLQMLRDSEGVETTIDELARAGEADLGRNRDAIVAACAQFAPGQSVPACIARMEANTPADGMLAAATRQIDELRAFVRAKELVTIPSSQPILVRESPPYNRGSGAYFAPVGPFETNVASAYYISPDVRLGEADLLFVTVHEVMPGHYLQFLHSNASHSAVGKSFVGYGFAEGWAHYAEEMMWDAGLRGTAEAHVGQLANALLRNCRFLAAIGLHTQGMTLAQAEALFRDRCYQSTASARQSALRGTYDPLYLTYTLGKLMIRRLRDDWTATRGGRAGWKAFHDQFLSYGGPPIPLVRQSMMEEATPRTVF